MKCPVAIVIICCFFGLLLSGCLDTSRHALGDRQAGHHYFRMNLGTEPPTLDPAEADDLVSITVLGNIMRGLTQYGPHGQIIPAYAQRWTRSADSLHYTFYLRPDGRWSDGQPVTTKDFIYAWHRVLDPKVASPYAFLLFCIHNAQNYYSGKIKDFSAVGIHALGPYTLQVDLDRPVAYFLQIMAFCTTLPMREDQIHRYPTSFSEAGHFITNGPYTLDLWDHENEIRLTPNRYYWGGMPKNDGIQMLMIPDPNTSLIMYDNNELDFVETATSIPGKEVRRLKNRQDFHTHPLFGISYIGFNTQKKPFDNVLVRKAFIAAFDRTFIPKLFQGGESPITSWISPGLFAYNPKIGIGFDVQQARQYLAQAGYPNGKGFPTVEMVFANTTPENRQLAEIAQFQWHHNLGVPVEVKNVEWKVFLKQLDLDPPQIYRLQWYVDYPDPDSFMGVFISASGNSHTLWKNPQYDAWVNQAAVEQNPQKRLGLYNQAQKLLLEQDAVMMPLYAIPKSYLLKPNVQGFELNALNNVILDNVHFVKTQSKKRRT